MSNVPAAVGGYPAMFQACNNTTLPPCVLVCGLNKAGVSLPTELTRPLSTGRPCNCRLHAIAKNNIGSYSAPSCKVQTGTHHNSNLWGTTCPQCGQLPGSSNQGLLQPQSPNGQTCMYVCSLLQTVQPMYRQAAMKVGQLPSAQPHLARHLS